VIPKRRGVKRSEKRSMTGAGIGCELRIRIRTGQLLRCRGFGAARTPHGSDRIFQRLIVRLKNGLEVPEIARSSQTLGRRGSRLAYTVPVVTAQHVSPFLLHLQQIILRILHAMAQDAVRFCPDGRLEYEQLLEEDCETHAGPLEFFLWIIVWLGSGPGDVIEVTGSR
jgi:hypothetical protein